MSTPARYRWLATRDEILAAPEVRRVGAASAFVRLVLGDVLVERARGARPYVLP